MKRSISMTIGKGSVTHNSRKFVAENVDATRICDNRVYIDEPIKDVYHQLFDEALARYNDKQKRKDRRIDDYYEKIRTGKQEKLFHEVILQIGNKDDMSAQTPEGERAAVILNDYAVSFQQRNPNLRVFSAHLHMDEATPHLHIDFVPFVKESRRGLDTRVSLKGALASQGFTGGTRGNTEWNQWVHSEKEELARIMEGYGIEWNQLGTHEKHLSVMDYKKEQREKEVMVLEKSLTKLRNLQVDVQAVGQIDVKKVPLSSKVMLEKGDYQTLVAASQKYTVQVKREDKLEKLLDAANRKITQLEKRVLELLNSISVLTKQLDQYRSVREQLSVSTLKKENKELRKNIGFYKSIIEQHGLGHLLAKKKEQRQTRDAR